MTGTENRPQSTSPDDKRARILEAALTLFEARGFDAVAVPEIGRQAGVATGTIYRHFRDKADLVNALYRQWRRAYNEIVLAPSPPRLSAKDRFARLWHRMTLFARTYPRAARFLELHHHGAYLDAESRQAGDPFRDMIQGFAAEAGASGAIRPIAPAMVAALMWGAAAGLAKFAADGALDFDAGNAAAMGEALWRAIAADAA